MSRLNRRYSLLLSLLCLFSTLRAEVLVDAPGRFTVDIAQPIKRQVKQNETDDGTVVICDLFHRDSDTLQWITYSDYPAGTMAERNPVKIYDRWAKGEAAANDGKVRTNVIQQLGEIAGREFVIDLTKENKVIRARVYIVGDRTYRIWYSGLAGTENSPAVRHFLDSFRLVP
ncbi:MAG: hypothetical protein ABI222_07750 [Opitutaceae bacterium]